MAKKRKTRKVSDELFWKTLRSCGGFYAKTAKMLEKITGETYTRQAVYHRAKERPDELRDIREELVDVSEDVLQTIIRNPKTDPRIRLDGAKFVLRTLGKERGYGDEKETNNIVIPLFKFNSETKDQDKTT